MEAAWKYDEPHLHSVDLNCQVPAALLRSERSSDRNRVAAVVSDDGQISAMAAQQVKRSGTKVDNCK